MPPPEPNQFERHADESETEFDARLERLDKELGERLDKVAADDPLLTSPPKAFPIPEVLREPAGSARARGASPGAGDEATQSALTTIYAIGTDFGVTVIAGVAIGWVVDHFAKTSPWGILVGLALGFLLGGYRFFKEGMAANRKALEDLRERRAGHGSGGTRGRR